jgi:hypothetical protein
LKFAAFGEAEKKWEKILRRLHIMRMRMVLLRIQAAVKP